jgi:type IV pilus assembly protein PilF
MLLGVLSACGGGGVKRPNSSPRDDAASYNVQLGVAYLQQGNLAVAKEKLERAVQQNPRDPDVHGALALLYERLGEANKVDGHYRTALRLAPNNPDISNNYAVYLCKTSRTEEGVKRFLEVANNRLYRTPEAALTNAGVCLRSAQRFTEAEGNFKNALALQPGYSEALYQLGDLALQQGRALEAQQHVDRYLDRNKATADLLLLGLRAAHAQGNRDVREQYARRLRAEFPGSNQTRAIPELTRNPG